MNAKNPDNSPPATMASIVDRHNAVRETLEALVEREGVADVLGHLVELCVTKAERGGPDLHSWTELAATLDQCTDYALEQLVVDEAP